MRLRGAESVELVLVCPPPKTELAVDAVAVAYEVELLWCPRADVGVSCVTTILPTFRACM